MEIREFPRPKIGSDDGLLRIEATGICGSDVEQYKGHLSFGSFPVIPGHEPLGIIEEIGEAAALRWGVKVGDRVAVEILVPCRSCQLCLTGRYMACKNRKASHGYTSTSLAPSLWGGLAEHMYLAPGAILHPVRKDIPADVAVMFNPLGAGIRWALHLGGTQFGDTVLVLGSGQRGLAAVIAAKAGGAGTIIVTGLASDQHKLALAKEFGADHTVVADQEDVVERVAEITGGDMADVVLELTPMAAEPVGDALRSVRHGGRVVLAGLKGGRDIPVNTDLIINKAINLVGAYGVDARAYSQAIEIIESGKFPLEKMHTHSFSLDDTELAIQTLGGEVPGSGAIHVTVHPSS
jgi:threonine dehydrogenase-like Zn-dependent dehydrogenase